MQGYWAKVEVQTDKHFTYFIDTWLPFGGRKAPGIFHRLSQAIKKMMARRGYDAIVVYLDDFPVIGATKAECHAAYECLLNSLQDLGFQISWHKVVPPTQQLTFLGIELNSVTQCMALPQSKLVELQEVIKGFTTRIRASKRQLQQLAGKLSWACRVVYGGRTFLRRILDVIGSLSSSSARYKLSAGFYEDIQWWDTFLATFNGRQLFLQPVSAQVQTDACHQAAGAFFEGDWLYHNFACDSPSLAALHINHKETTAVYLAAEWWAPQWANQHIVVASDNQATVAIINKGSTPNRLTMGLLRRLFWLSATYNFRLTATYIPGKSNMIADAFSRLHSHSHLFFAWHVLARYSRPSVFP